MNRINIHSKIRLLWIGALFTGLLTAGDVRDLISRADIVAIGSAETRIETQDKVSLTLLIERAIKGKATPSSSLYITHPWKRKIVVPFSASSQIEGRLFGIWFLKKALSGDWDVLATGGPDGLISSLFLPTVERSSEANQQNPLVAPEDQVLSELSAALQVSKTDPEALLYAGGPLDSPAMQTAIVDFLGMSDLSFQAVGLAILLTQSKQGALAHLTEMWPAVREARNSSLVTWALRNDFRDTTASSVSELAAIADQPATSDLRGASIWALKAIHTKESLPFLASLLSSIDSGEQMSGVIGLSSFANGCPPQTPNNVASLDYTQFKNPSPYRTQQTVAAFASGPLGSERERELVAFWSTWWNENKASLTN